MFTPDGRQVVALRYDPNGTPDNESLVVLDATTLAPVGESRCRSGTPAEWSR